MKFRLKSFPFSHTENHKRTISANAGKPLNYAWHGLCVFGLRARYSVALSSFTRFYCIIGMFYTIDSYYFTLCYTNITCKLLCVSDAQKGHYLFDLYALCMGSVNLVKRKIKMGRHGFR